MSKAENDRSHLKTMPYPEFQRALKLNRETCERIAKLAKVQIPFDATQPPGEILMKMLYRYGCTVKRFREMLTEAQTVKTIYYRPTSKVAVLIANDKYEHLSKLATPSIDCDSLSSILKSQGFIVVMIKNTASGVLKDILSKVFTFIPEDSYCFIFYAGHGCELVNTKCMLGIDCPVEDIRLSHCITENFILQQVYECKPDLCVLIKDMCRIHLDRNTHPEVYASLGSVDNYDAHKYLIIGYSTLPSQSAYEVLQIECSNSIDGTYELQTGDTGKIVPSGSQYVNALCTRLGDDLDISSLLDKVHIDVESSMKKQRPIKVQWGAPKRSLHDPPTDDTITTTVLEKLKEFAKEYEAYCSVF